MCYMGEDGDRPGRPARVGVRELRQNLSVYLERVKQGETLEVTEHGQPVAQLGPRPPATMSVIDRLIAEGRITPASRSHREIPPPPGIPGRPLLEILLEMRDEEER